MIQNSKFKIQNSKFVRLPAVAGAFYPASEEALLKKVDIFLAQTEDVKTAGRAKVLIVPHAGYDYSGQVAAHAYKKIQNEKYKTVVLLGGSHRAYFEGISIFPQGYFRTPSGDVEIDANWAGKIIAANPRRFNFYPEAHQEEHSLEVQLPFLQQTLGRFKIVPIVIGDADEEDCQLLAEVIFKNNSEDVLIVASSDLSHYPPYDIANYVDNKTIDVILSGEPAELDKVINDLMGQGLENLQTCLCGEAAVKTAMYLAKKMEAGEAKLLRYANSGDVSGDKSQVVGYAAIAFCIK